MIAIVDASVAAKWLFLEEGSRQAENLLEEISFFLVPSLFVIEIDAVISKKVRQRKVSIDEALQKNEQRKKLPYKVVRYTDVSPLALEISISLPITLYDATYIATAIENDGIVYTADQKLANGVSNTSLSEYVQSIWNL